MEWLSSPWASSVAQNALGWWRTSFPAGRACACHCACDIFGSTDRELISALRGQLDRCGPDQLKIPAALPPPPCACAAPTGSILLYLVLFILGVAAGSGLT